MVATGGKELQYRSFDLIHSPSSIKANACLALNLFIVMLNTKQHSNSKQLNKKIINNHAIIISVRFLDV